MTISLADINIRPFTTDDIPAVLEKHKELYAQEFNYPPDRFGKSVSEGLDEFVHDGTGLMWIAEHHPNPNSCGKDVVWAGCVAVTPIKRSEVTGRLRFMLVAPEFRSCGLGQRLMNTALNYCLEKKYKRMTLSTTGDCVSAHRLYGRYGFKVVEVTKGTPWGGMTHEWWEKDLEESN
jgi:GNAT superfamily N-acetyltransferase